MNSEYYISLEICIKGLSKWDHHHLTNSETQCETHSYSNSSEPPTSKKVIKDILPKIYKRPAIKARKKKSLTIMNKQIPTTDRIPTQIRTRHTSNMSARQHTHSTNYFFTCEHTISYTLL